MMDDQIREISKLSASFHCILRRRPSLANIDRVDMLCVVGAYLGLGSCALGTIIATAK